MSGVQPRQRRSGGMARWVRKFRDAGAGVVEGVATESSMRVHFAVGAAVVAAAAILDVEAWRWAVLLICIAVVLASEYFNSAIEQVIGVLHPAHDDRLGRALHLAAGGVLVAAILAAIVGGIVLVPPALHFFAG